MKTLIDKMGFAKNTLNVTDLLSYIGANHECKHLFWRKRRGQDIDELDKLMMKYRRENIFFNIIRKDGLRDCLFFDFDSKTNPELAIKEGKEFSKKLNDEGIPTYEQLSGSKGVHVFIWIPPINWTFYKQYMEKIVEEYKLKYFDRAVLKNGLQLARVPTSINVKTMRECEPLTDEIKCYSGLEDNIMENEKSFLNYKNTPVLEKQYNSELDARTLISHYGLNSKELGHKHILLCPFHNDKNPSAVMFPEGIFHCSTCNISLTAYQFIAKMENLDPADTKDVGRVIYDKILS